MVGEGQVQGEGQASDRCQLEGESKFMVEVVVQSWSVHEFREEGRRKGGGGGARERSKSLVGEP